MNKDFKRVQYLPVLFLAPAILFGFATVLQLAMGSPVAFVTLIASVLFFINSIWMFTTPLVSITNNTIFFKEALLKQKEIPIGVIERIDSAAKNKIDIYKKGGRKITIRLNAMKSDERKDFEQVITELLQSQQ